MATIAKKKGTEKALSIPKKGIQIHQIYLYIYITNLC